MDFSSSIKSHFFYNHDFHYNFFCLIHLFFMVCWMIFTLQYSLERSSNLCHSHTSEHVPFTNLMYVCEQKRKERRKQKNVATPLGKSCFIAFVIIRVHEQVITTIKLTSIKMIGISSQVVVFRSHINFFILIHIKNHRNISYWFSYLATNNFYNGVTRKSHPNNAGTKDIRKRKSENNGFFVLY